MKRRKVCILICGVLPKPYFGHSMLYEMLMKSSFFFAYDVKFLNMHFWSYETNKKITGEKLLKLIKYYCQYLRLILLFHPRYILFNISFYKLPFLKDFIFCATGILLGKRVVLHDHGQYVKELYDSLPKWQQGMLLWMLRQSAGSIIMGEGVKPFYEGLMPLDKLFVVPGTVEDTKAIPVLGHRDVSAMNILYFSYLSRFKGAFVAFDAASIILKRQDNASLTFAGPIENDAVKLRLEGLQKEYPGRVRYMGYVEDVSQRTALFREADIFMFTTLRDVFGLVLLHAMAEGVPVVASKEGTIPEIVVDGQTGFLCEKGNAEDFAKRILQLLSDDALREKMSKESRARFESFYSLKRYGERMVEVFSSM